MTESFVCFMAQPFPLLDELGVRQVVMPRAEREQQRGRHRVRDAALPNLLRPAFEELRPAYIYERLCLGNSAAALLSARVRDPVHRRIQRLRDLDAAQLRRHRLRLRRRVPRGRGAGVRAGDADQRRLGGDPQRTWWHAASTRRRFWSTPTASISTPMPRRLRPRREAIRRELGFDAADRVDRLHRHVRRLARHRRVERGDPADLPATRPTRSSCSSATATSSTWSIARSRRHGLRATA